MFKLYEMKFIRDDLGLCAYIDREKICNILSKIENKHSRYLIEFLIKIFEIRILIFRYIKIVVTKKRLFLISLEKKNWKNRLIKLSFFNEQNSPTHIEI